jgi:hypothetical protein
VVALADGQGAVAHVHVGHLAGAGQQATTENAQV